MKKYIIATIMLLSTSTQAETLKGGYPACLTEELFNQIATLATKRDYKGMEYLLNNGCIEIKKGIEVSVLEKKLWSGSAKIRAYVGNEAIVLWTDIGNITK